MINSFNGHSWILKKLVLPQHTDHAGVMWHGSYLNWLEESRIDALKKVGLPYSQMSEEGFEMPMISLTINYIIALHHGEEVFIKSWSLPQKGARWPWRTKFFREDLSLAADAKVELVLTRYLESKIRLLRYPPPHIAMALLNLQKGPID